MIEIIKCNPVSIQTTKKDILEAHLMGTGPKAIIPHEFMLGQVEDIIANNKTPECEKSKSFENGCPQAEECLASQEHVYIRTLGSNGEITADDSNFLIYVAVINTIREKLDNATETEIENYKVILEKYKKAIKNDTTTLREGNLEQNCAEDMIVVNNSKRL